VSGCLLGGYPVGLDQWGGNSAVEGCLPRINISVERVGRIGHHDRCLLTLVLICTLDGVCVIVYV
jgi:hypothetical protein